MRFFAGLLAFIGLATGLTLDEFEQLHGELQPSEDAAWRIRELIVLEIDRFAEGKPPRYVAKPETEAAPK